MSKSTIFLLLLFVLTLFVFYEVQSKNKINPKKVFTQITTTITPFTQTSLSLKPNPLSVTAEKATEANIVIDSQGEIPTVVQLEMAYNPALINNVSVTPGNFFKNPQVLLNTVDAKAGRISYALQSRLNPQNASHSGIVAVMHFTPYGATAQTQITFLPKTTVRTNNDSNTLQAAYGTIVTFTYQRRPSLPVGIKISPVDKK